MSAWMLLTLLASCLVAGAALAVEETARLLRRPARWGWIAAMAAAVGLPALFRFIPAAPEPASEAAAIDADMLTALLARAAEVDSATGALDRLLDAALSDSLLLGVWLADGTGRFAEVPQVLAEREIDHSAIVPSSRPESVSSSGAARSRRIDPQSS